MLEISKKTLNSTIHPFDDQFSPISTISWLSCNITLIGHILSKINFTADDNSRVIRSLDSVNKDHSYKELNFCMLKTCWNCISSLLALTFHKFLGTGRSCQEFQKVNITPVHKEDDIQTIKSYHTISLFPICGKVFNKLIDKEIFKFFINNKLNLSNQSGFKTLSLLYYSVFIHRSWNLPILLQWQGEV